MSEQGSNPHLVNPKSINHQTLDSAHVKGDEEQEEVGNAPQPCSWSIIKTELKIHCTRQRNYIRSRNKASLLHIQWGPWPVSYRMVLSPTLFSHWNHLESLVTQWHQINEMSVPATNSVVACYSSDPSGFVFTQKEYQNLVFFILGESFNYWATAEQGYQQQLFLQLCFKLNERGMVSTR